MKPAASDPTRRTFLVAAGALVVTFSLAPRRVFGEDAAEGARSGPRLSASLTKTPWLDAWIRIDGDGRITVFTGKAELGQGIKTALLQVAADELEVAPTVIEMVTADTGRTPDEGVTAGSHSMQDSGTAIRQAAAQVRQLLLESAGKRWGIAPDLVTTTGTGSLRAPDGREAAYGELAAELSLHVEAKPEAPLRTAKRRVIGQNLPRLDIPAKLTGGAAYVQDMRLPGMLHARVVRGPSFGTRPEPIDAGGLSGLPGFVSLVRKGNFTAIVAENEWSAIVGMRQLQAAGWHRTAAPLPTAPTDAILQSLEFEDVAVEKVAGTAGAPVRSLKARYSRPWLMHGSIGPSCAVAWLDGGMMTVWTHSQGVYPLRKALAELLHMTPDKVRCIHVQGAGCYGHNGADDVAADAALVALAMPGRPIRLQWMREQEHGWEPLGPGMLVELEASLDADQRIVAWKHAVWSNGHNDRPVTAGGLLAGGEVDPPFPAQRQRPIPMPEGGGDRNSNPLYAFPNIDVVYHFLPHAPLRVSALRSLGAQMNIFAIESFMDELARAASSDPVAFRLAHMRDPRARDVITMAAERFGWTNRPKPDGRAGAGFAFARYKNLGAYCALARLRGLGQFLISRFKEINTLT